MALTPLPDTEIDALIAARIHPLQVEEAQHRLNALAQGDRLDAAITAHTATPTAATLAELRNARDALLQTRRDIATITRAATALDRIGTAANSGQRVRNRSNQAMTAAEAVVIPEVTP
jgi:hypothetical protein